MATNFTDISSLKVKANRKATGRGELCGADVVREIFGVSEKTLGKYRSLGIVRNHGIGGPTGTANLYYRNLILVQAQLKQDLIQTMASKGRPKNKWLGERCRACCGMDDEVLMELLDERQMSVEKVVAGFRKVLESVHERDKELLVDNLKTEVEALLAEV